eukprot:scaffold1.g5606.t1
MYSGSLFPVQSWEQGAVEAIGLTTSQLRFTVSFLLSVAAGAVLRVLPTPRGERSGALGACDRSRHLFSIVVGFLLIYYPFSNGVLNAFVPTSLAYLFMRRFRQHCGTLTWLTAFPYLIFWCAERERMRHMAALPLARPQFARSGAAAAAACAWLWDLRPYPTSKRLEQLPSQLEYWSYVFAGGNLLAGPFFEARDWFDYVARRGPWDERYPEKRIPSALVPGLARLVKGLICAALWVQLSSRFNADLLESPWLGLIWLVGFTARCKYYFAWVEFSGSLATLAANWNICTGVWLRHYVYDRLTPPGRPAGLWQLVATQTVSGVWHGIFPGYWLFFLSRCWLGARPMRRLVVRCQAFRLSSGRAIMFNSSRIVYRYEQTWPARGRRFPLWTALKVVATALVLNYAATAFIVLWLHDTLAVWRSVYFCGHAFVLVLHVVAAVMPPRRRKARLVPERAGPAPGADGGGGAHADGPAAVEQAAAAANSPADGAATEGKKED